MAPKNKKGGGSGGGKGKGGASGVVDGVDMAEMSREQLEQHVTRLRQEIEREREERNFFQLERDKLRTFWEMTRQQLEETRAEVRNKDREMQLLAQKNQAHANLLKQRVKHLQFQHSNHVCELKADTMVSLKITQEQFYKQEAHHFRDKKELKDKLFEQQREFEEVERRTRLEVSENLSNAREQLLVTAKEVEDRYTARVEELREQMQLKHSTDLAELEERKNKHIAQLIRQHDASFLDMKNYYNDVTLNNLALISSLKDQMEEMKRREERMEKTLREVQKENKCLTEPMRKAKEEANELARQLNNYQKDKASLATTKHCLQAVQKQFQNLQWEYETVKQKLVSMTAERDALRSRFDAAVQEVQRKASLRLSALQRKLELVTVALENREIEFENAGFSAGSHGEGQSRRSYSGMSGVNLLK